MKPTENLIWFLATAQYDVCLRNHGRTTCLTSYQDIRDNGVWLRTLFALPPHEFKVYLPPIERENVMARKGRFTEIDFVTLTLSRSEAGKFTKWVSAQDKPITLWVANLVTDGYKVSVSADFERSCVIVAVTGKDTAAFNTNRCFTSRAEELEEALWLAVYKHYIVCDGADWGEPSEDSMSWG